ncbi:MAG: glycosyltransferase family 1 protein, partial [Pseudomonadales bacterium]|nr:glycosyltransferase family 1 protein [Pseudomonadales bacterium]
MSRPMHFLLYSRINADNIGRSLGAPEYSYYFLLKEFRVAFERLGSVTIVEDPAAEADAAYDRCRARGEDCVLVAFTAPQNLPEVRRCPVVPL